MRKDVMLCYVMLQVKILISVPLLMGLRTASTHWKTLKFANTIVEYLK